MTHVEMPGLLVAKRQAAAIESMPPVEAPPVIPASEPPKRDRSALTLLAAMGVALAVTSGAALSSFATGGLQEVVRSIGLSQGEAIETEQRRQARTVAALERKLDLVGDHVAGLAQQVAADTLASGRLARMEADVTTLRQELAAQRAALAQAQPTPDGPADPHATAFQQLGIGIAALRSSFDERDLARGQEIAAVARRVDRLEQLVAAHEVTGTVRPHVAPAPRKRPHRANTLAQWSAQPDITGVAVVNERGERFMVARGTQVPGLGRITDVRRQGDRWVVVTRRGLLVADR